MNVDRLRTISLLLVLFAATVSPAGAEPHKESELSRDQRMAWWREAKFGMFVHWGIYSVTGGEYNGQKLPNSAEWMMARGKIPIAEYEQYAARFNPTKFNAHEFVKLAKDAGMKYLVITAKHHDGFAMFDSKSNDFNVVDSTPFKRDIMKELAEACQEQGIRFGFYYSQAQDWHHPGGFGNGWDKSLRRVSNDDYVSQKAAPEVKQLLTEYGPIGIFWWDTPRKMSKKSFDDLHSLTSLQEEVITNDRLGDDYPGDYKTFERRIPDQAPATPDWEVCMPISGSWGYKRSDTAFKSTTTLVRNLADIASKGGNYLLNVSPTGEGTLLPQAIERLEEVGEWMKVNGESIYDTTASPFGPLEWGRCTKRVSADGVTLFLHVFDWPKDGKLLAPGLRNEVEEAYLLDGGVVLEAATDDGGVVVDLPGDAPNRIDGVVVLKVRGELDVESDDATVSKNSSLILTADAAYLHNNEGAQEIRVREHQGVSHLGYWTDPEAWVEWSVRIERPGAYDVWAELAIEGKESRFEIGVPDQLLSVKVASTGSYHNYASQRLGTIHIDKVGRNQVRIKPESEHWRPVNIRTVELRPSASGGN